MVLKSNYVGALVRVNSRNFVTHYFSLVLYTLAENIGTKTS